MVIESLFVLLQLTSEIHCFQTLIGANKNLLNQSATGTPTELTTQQIRMSV